MSVIYLCYVMHICHTGTGMQVTALCNFDFWILQICKFANLQIRKFVNSQIWNCVENEKRVAHGAVIAIWNRIASFLEHCTRDFQVWRFDKGDCNHHRDQQSNSPTVQQYSWSSNQPTSQPASKYKDSHSTVHSNSMHKLFFHGCSAYEYKLK